MSRVQRPFGYLTQQEVNLGTGDAQVALTINAPFLGAVVQSMILMVKTAGAGAGTYDSITLQGETGNTVLATYTTAIVAGTPAVDTEVFNIPGNGNRTDEVDLELDVATTGTISTQIVGALSIIWG